MAMISNLRSPTSAITTTPLSSSSAKSEQKIHRRRFSTLRFCRQTYRKKNRLLNGGDLQLGGNGAQPNKTTFHDLYTKQGLRKMFPVYFFIVSICVLDLASWRTTYSLEKYLLGFNFQVATAVGKDEGVLKVAVNGMRSRNGFGLAEEMEPWRRRLLRSGEVSLGKLRRRKQPLDLARRSLKRS